MFYDTFELLCKQQGVSCRKAAEDIGLSNSTTTKWKKGSTPKGETAQKIADYFGVSVDFLLGRTDDPTDYSNPDLIAGISGDILAHFNGDIRKAAAFNDAVKADVKTEQRITGLMQKFAQLDEADKGKAEDFISYLLTNDKYKSAQKQA